MQLGEESACPPRWPRGQSGSWPWRGRCEPGRGNLPDKRLARGQLSHRLAFWSKGTGRGDGARAFPGRGVRSGVGGAGVSHALQPWERWACGVRAGMGGQLIIDCSLRAAFQIRAQGAHLRVLIPPAHRAVAGRPPAVGVARAPRPGAGPSALSGSGVNSLSSFLWAPLPHRPPAPESPLGRGPLSPTSPTRSASGRRTWARGALDNPRPGSRWFQPWASVFLSPGIFDCSLPAKGPWPRAVWLDQKSLKSGFSSSRVGGSAGWELGWGHTHHSMPIFTFAGLSSKHPLLRNPKAVPCKALKKRLQCAPPSPARVRRPCLLKTSARRSHSPHSLSREAGSPRGPGPTSPPLLLWAAGPRGTRPNGTLRPCP